MDRVLAHGQVAVGFLAAVLSAQDEDLGERIQSTLVLARPALMAQLEQARTLGGGALALSCLAALHDQVPPDEPVLAAALSLLSHVEMEQTYPMSLRLMVAAACPTLSDRQEVAEADYERLLRNRRDGAFGYHTSSSEWDLSNTQYAALGLRAAASLGIKVPRRVWTGLGDAMLDAQSSDGGFGYHETGGEPYPSMTVAGIAVMAICRQALARPGRTIPALDKRIAKGWKWMADNQRAIGEAGERWSFYFHYGLERAAILCDVTQVGTVDWYQQGARMLIKQQQSEGGWKTGFGDAAKGPPKYGSPIDTAFAVLFLRRSFRKEAGPLPVPVTGSRGTTLLMLEDNSTGQDVHRCAEGLVRRGKRAMPDILKALRSEVGPRRRAAALAMALIAKTDFGFDADSSLEENREALHEAELWYLKNR